MPSTDQRPTQTFGNPTVRHAHHSPVRPWSLFDAPVQSPRNKGAEGSVHRALMALASRPGYGVTLALAGVIAHSWHVRGVRYFPLFGLDAETTYRLLSAHFPGIGRLMAGVWGRLVLPEQFEEAYALADVVELLDQYRTVLDEDSTWLAHALATACLSSDELWRDMNLSSASVLHDLFHDFFTVFAARNRSDMSWKKFLQCELSERDARDR